MNSPSNTLLRLARKLFDDSHETFRESVRRFINQEIAPHYAQWEKDGIVSREVWQAAGEAGLLCTWVPEEYGGAGMDTIAYVLAMEEICKVDASAGVVMSVNNSLVCWGIQKHGSEKQSYLLFHKPDPLVFRLNYRRFVCQR